MPESQDVDGAAPGYFTLQPCQELLPGRSVFVKGKGGNGVGLGFAQERGELHQINAILAVVIVVIASTPADAAVARRRLADSSRSGRLARVSRQRGADKAFQSCFSRVGSHLLLEWIDRNNPVVALTMVQIFSVDFVAAGGFGGSDDSPIPVGNLVAPTNRRSRAEDILSD